ncbi:MAG: SIS domain-containing protein [Bacteroidetes bacterium]|nr:SIS domain-containing protein [Bacteroidota bacterium]
MADKILEVKANDHTVFLIGNGGSSATPSHSAGDWLKELELNAICLSDNIPAVTAFANDTGYDNVFLGQLKIFLSEGDIVIGYSGSGNSINVINAVKYARNKGNFVIGITGNYNNGKGGLLQENSDLGIVVDSESMERIEDSHLIINHLVKEYIKEKYIKAV